GMSVVRREDPWPVYGTLLLTVILSVAVLGAVPASGVQEVVVNGLLGASLVLAVHIERTDRALIIAAYALAALGVVVAILHAATASVSAGQGRLMSAALVAVGPPAVGIGIIRNLRAHGRVRIEAVTGVLSFYMLLGMTFAFTYGAIDALGGHPFF